MCCYTKDHIPFQTIGIDFVKSPTLKVAYRVNLLSSTLTGLFHDILVSRFTFTQLRVPTRFLPLCIKVVSTVECHSLKDGYFQAYLQIFSIFVCYLTKGSLLNKLLCPSTAIAVILLPKSGSLKIEHSIFLCSSFSIHSSMSA